jgi:hypothetical protein
MKILGLPVVDAKKPIVLTVTKDDIKNAHKHSKDPEGCVAAQAAMRQEKAISARVHLGRVYIRKGKNWIRYYTPHNLRNEIIAFDRGGSFSTGDFNLVPVSPARQGIGYRYGTPSDNVTGAHRRAHIDIPDVRQRMKTG